MRNLVLLLVILTIGTSCLHFLDQEESVSYPSVSAKTLVDSLKIPKENLSIFIDKSDYTLSLLNGADTLKQYEFVLGSNPDDDKRMEGDGCTPEGKFKIRDLYPHNMWSKFIWINYPTEDSYRKFKESKAKGEIPQDATIGGEIGIHGVPDDTPELIADGRNWTLGCVSLSNESINDLYEVCYVGMGIEIRK
jgi:murein L,D-transpeptidase YafK